MDSMNYDGELFLEGEDPSTGFYSYFLSDGYSITPVLSEVPRMYSPVLTNDNHVFYLSPDSSGTYSLMEIAVPEPDALLIIAAASIFLGRRRRRAGEGVWPA
jgi:hypothetical protein